MFAVFVLVRHVDRSWSRKPTMGIQGIFIFDKRTWGTFKCQRAQLHKQTSKILISDVWCTDVNLSALKRFKHLPSESEVGINWCNRRKWVCGNCEFDLAPIKTYSVEFLESRSLSFVDSVLKVELKSSLGNCIKVTFKISGSPQVA